MKLHFAPRKPVRTRFLTSWHVFGAIDFRGAFVEEATKFYFAERNMAFSPSASKKK
jgi:hypothetical protein